MSVKRRDNKNRVLRNGESQRKDGRYAFKYLDSEGKPNFVYSWKLVDTDALPAGKRECIPLRDKELEILKTINDDSIPKTEYITVLELVEKYILQKKGVRHSTRAGYKTVINLLKAKEKEFGSKRINEVKLSDAKQWLIDMQQNERGYSSICTIRGILRPAFQMAMDDDIISKNPFQFNLGDVLYNDSKKREALTKEQENAFLRFVQYDKHFSKYYEAIFVLFKTGLRISEFCGLTLSDIDLEEKTISVNHQLQRTSNMEYVIEKTKTNAGTRILPMNDELCSCFENIIKNRKVPSQEPEISGYSGFLYLDKNDMPMVALHWEHYFQRICAKYNKLFKVPMPKVTPHVCRHTYCSNMVKKRINPKSLQYLMGHSEIGTTLDTYTHINYEDARAELIRLEQEETAV